MLSLDDYGWNDFHHNNNFRKAESGEQHAGRVLSIKGFKYFVITSKGELECELAGRLLYGAQAEDLPKVGDWVMCLAFDTTGYVVDVLPRRNALARKTPGKKVEKQILACNVDYAIIVQGVDRDFNLSRLERYLAQVLACQVEPVIVLNKVDLVADATPFVKQVESLQRNSSVHLCSTISGLGLETLRASLVRTKTYIMIGSSGVGKSSLLNALLHARVQKTNAISDFNAKGRHTTTSRDLFQLPGGALLIDSPGMREFGFTSEDGTDASMLFPGIAALAPQCRFPDCIHVNEPGCAVLDALSSGNLEPTIYDNYIKQMKEQRRFEITAEDRKRMNKQSGRMIKEAVNFRKKYKY